MPCHMHARGKKWRHHSGFILLTLGYLQVELPVRLEKELSLLPPWHYLSIMEQRILTLKDRQEVNMWLSSCYSATPLCG